MDAMEVAAVGQTRINESSMLKNAEKVVKVPVKVEAPPEPEPVMTAEELQRDLQQLREALDRMVANTRFTYYVNEKIDQFVVRIVDRDTDNVIKEIPSREIQRMHENIQEAIGLIFDTLI